MNRNNASKLIIVVLVLIWSFFEAYPPMGKNLATEFKSKAVRTDDPGFKDIVSKLDALQVKDSEHPYQNIITATGTNNIEKFFPFYDVANEEYPNRAILNHLQKESAGKIRLGLDLQGGTSFTVKMDTNHLESSTNAAASQSMRDAAISQAAEVLRRRVDKFGVAEPIIQPEGDDRILIQLPGLSEAEKDLARTNIQKAAFLQFSIVHEHSGELIGERLKELQEAGVTGSQLRERLTKSVLEPGYQVLVQRPKTTAGVQQTNLAYYLVKKNPEMTGKHIVSAFVTRNPTDPYPEIAFSLDKEGTDLFGQITTDNLGRDLAIILDGELQSAPRIKSAIDGGSGTISGQFSPEEAAQLANALQNPLQAPVTIIQENSVDPTLGSATIKSGVYSAIIGTIAVALFMIIYYMFAGAIADVALITNIIILLGVMCSFDTTLTLPGIAGIVLTIGMAVDANVLIFERIREESAKGKSLRGSLDAGYSRAFGTIFDSHVTTLISSIILWNMGTGSIKGFGVTLTIGVAASLFTALVVTRLIFDFVIDKGMITKLPMLHIIRASNIDFMKLAKPAFALSWGIIIVGLCYGLFIRGDKMLGISFKGGDNLVLSFTQKVDGDKLASALTKGAGVVDPVIQYQKDTVTSKETLSITTETGTSPKVEQVLAKEFPGIFTRIGSEQVGPTIGKEIQYTAIMASLWSLLGILLYVAVRYEFSFAVGAVVAVLHDVLMTIGCYCLTGMFGHGREFNATMVAAVLTIIGFSINDTIVIFDRIREDLKMGVRGSFRDLINQALNQTLSRTIITSGTVFIATMSLYLFGGGAINDFAFTFLIGIITGTYSSIYIASALVLWWHKGERPKATGGGASPVAQQREATVTATVKG